MEIEVIRASTRSLAEFAPRFGYSITGGREPGRDFPSQRNTWSERLGRDGSAGMMMSGAFSA
jgi:hypothetical protein